MDSEKIVFGKKLLDRRWLELERKVIESAEQFCQCCGKPSECLQAHFFRYSTTEPWEESQSNLTALCEGCHTSEHGMRSAAERHLLDAFEQMNFLAVDVLELIPFALTNFQARDARMADDRVRRLETVRKELCTLPEIAELAEQFRKISAHLWSRVQDGLSNVSDEYYDLQSQLKGLMEERRKCADLCIANGRSIAPPDEQTRAKLRLSYARSLEAECAE
jgi:hypothetical protein